MRFPQLDSTPIPAWADTGYAVVDDAGDTIGAVFRRREGKRQWCAFDGDDFLRRRNRRAIRFRTRALAGAALAR